MRCKFWFDKSMSDENKTNAESEASSDVPPSQNETEDVNLLSAGQGFQNPALWFFLLLIPILLSFLFTFKREAPKKIAKEPQTIEAQQQTLKEKRDQILKDNRFRHMRGIQ